MRVHAFLATAAELPGLLDGGTAPPPGTLLGGVDPVNLASLVEIVTGGGIASDAATPLLEKAVLSAGPRGPSIHALPTEAVEALGNADPAERVSWAEEWTGGNGRPNDAPEKALEALTELAARRAADQGLYLWVADGG